jgi:hypothetical protein
MRPRWLAALAVLLLAVSALACQARPGAQSATGAEPAPAAGLQEVTLDVPTLI